MSTMAFKVFSLLINGLVPVIPAWFITNSHPETAVIKPWPIVWTDRKSVVYGKIGICMV